MGGIKVSEKLSFLLVGFLPLVAILHILARISMMMATTMT